MSLYPITLLMGLSALAIAVGHLKQTLANYYDFVALFVVFGGTGALFILLLPWQARSDLKSAMKELLFGGPPKDKLVLRECLDFIQTGKVEAVNGQFHRQTLRDGLELMQLGFDQKRITAILEERLQQMSKRRRRVANSFRNLAKYPPAFGLIGTVLGLVTVMRGVSTGLDGKQTALEMAIALVATMYGLFLANLVINPAGELILKNTVEAEAHGLLSIKAVSLLMEKRSLLESQEVLNSHVAPESRISTLNDSSFAEAS